MSSLETNIAATLAFASQIQSLTEQLRCLSKPILDANISRHVSATQHSDPTSKHGRARDIDTQDEPIQAIVPPALEMSKQARRTAKLLPDDPSLLEDNPSSLLQLNPLTSPTQNSSTLPDTIGYQSTELTEAHIQDLEIIWELNPCVPSLSSRRAWALAHNAPTRLVVNWFTKKKALLRSRGDFISDENYELSSDAPASPQMVLDADSDDKTEFARFSSPALSIIDVFQDSDDTLYASRNSPKYASADLKDSHKHESAPLSPLPLHSLLPLDEDFAGQFEQSYSCSPDADLCILCSETIGTLSDSEHHSFIESLSIFRNIDANTAELELYRQYEQMEPFSLLSSAILLDATSNNPITNSSTPMELSAIPFINRSPDLSLACRSLDCVHSTFKAANSTLGGLF